MSPERETDESHLTAAWNEHRAYLVNLAFRMLGDIGEAEDTVQEAFSRLVRADLGAIEDDRGWLIVVTSRLCLDQLRSARSRRERYQGVVDPEPAVGSTRAIADPADRVTLDDSIRLALLVILERLSPAERVVFVLHDMFEMPFEDIAETVGRSAAACRQLAGRARRRIGEDGSSGARFEIDAGEHRLVTERFIAACNGGDLTALLEVLAPDVVGEADRGAATRRRRRVVGARPVARNLVHFWSAATLVSQRINGEPGVLAFLDRQLAGVIVLGIHDGRIDHVHVIADPAKLAFISAQLVPNVA